MHNHLGKLPTRRHSLISKQTHSLFQKISVKKEPWCFPCNQKFASFIQKQTKITRNKSSKSRQICIKLFMYKVIKSKEKIKLGPPLKIYQLMSQGARMDCRHEIPNHGIILLFLKSKLYLPIYNHSHQPMKIEGDQVEC